MARSADDFSLQELVDSNRDMQELIGQRLPAVFKSPTWEFWATAMLARCAGIMDSIVNLVEAGHRADAEVALRTLYLQVLALCWVAIDPETNLDLWREGSEAHLKTFSNEATELFGLTMPEGQRAGDYGGRAMKSTEQMANDVDTEWPKKVSAFRAHPRRGKKLLLSFRGNYLSIFRTTSRLVHAEVNSLESNLRVRPNYLLVTSSEPSSVGRIFLGLPMLAFAVLVYNHHFGWPGEPRAKDLEDALLHEPVDDEQSSGTN